MPAGRYSIISTSARPKSSIRMTSGLDQHPAEQGLLHGLDRVAQDLGDERQQDGAEDHAVDVAHAAQHDHRQHHDRLDQHEALRADEALGRREDTAGNAAERSAHGERQQLHVPRVDAHRPGGDLVLADRLPGPADP